MKASSYIHQRKTMHNRWIIKQCNNYIFDYHWAGVRHQVQRWLNQRFHSCQQRRQQRCPQSVTSLSSHRSQARHVAGLSSLMTGYSRRTALSCVAHSRLCLHRTSQPFLPSAVERSRGSQLHTEMKQSYITKFTLKQSTAASLKSMKITLVAFFISNQSRPGNDRALENHSFLVPGQKLQVLFHAQCCPGKPDFYPVKNWFITGAEGVVQSAALFTSCYPAKSGVPSDI